MIAAYLKGREERHLNLPRRNPYPDVRTPAHNHVTFSRAFRKAWFDGWDDADKILRRRPEAVEPAEGLVHLARPTRKETACGLPILKKRIRHTNHGGECTCPLCIEEIRIVDPA